MCQKGAVKGPREVKEGREEGRKLGGEMIRRKRSNDEWLGRIETERTQAKKDARERRGTIKKEGSKRLVYVRKG